ncbi:hypothetical protein FAZ78_04440 [Cereibacter changlensis]|uniref:Uncharacterized protein n=1 Tax=Cereibacter changlensis TaxID=402884 RepID=A0A4V6WLR9_9RHOB|nr:hypothetical protein [Cereibacter changlensis]TKA97747.1 hypothetical protein FAZ78_04440 [Cereibacter changlensis]
MNDQEPLAQTSDNLTSDVRFMLDKARDSASTERDVRRAGVKFLAEVARRERSSRLKTYDAGIFVALLVLISLCWIGAVLAIYFV